jgi:glycosyltransferase involved in cell wall biosynthesis
MRILHATDTYGPHLGGIEVLVRTLAHSQAAAGHQVAVLTRTPGPPSPSGSPVEVHRDLSSLRSLVAQADVVHSHVSAYSPLALRAVEAGARDCVPSLATVHSVWGSAWPLFRAAAAVRGWTDLPIRWAAVSEVAAGPVRQAFGCDVLVVPNAVHTGYWAQQPTPRRSDRVTIVSVMRMSRRKRPFQLLTALRRARDVVPARISIEAVLVGDGPLRDAVDRRISRLGLAAWVHTPGDLSHERLRALYRDADIFVAPATLESFGLAALEARAAGLAVVGRSGTGVTEFVEHGVDGLLAGSDQELSDHLAGLCTDAPTRRRIVHHNHAVPPLLDWAHVGELNTAAYTHAGAVTGLRPTPRTPPLLAPPGPLLRGDRRTWEEQPEASGSPPLPAGRCLRP